MRRDKRATIVLRPRELDMLIHVLSVAKAGWFTHAEHQKLLEKIESVEVRGWPSIRKSR